MVRMKRILALFVLAVACQQVEPLVEPQVAEGPEFTAQMEEFDAETKTAYAYGTSVVWSSGDQIALFQGGSVADKYAVKNDYAGSKKGAFSIVENGKGSSSASFQTNVAVYPYSDDLSCAPVMENGVVASYQITGASIPEVQTYASGSFAEESFLMAAVTSDLSDRTLDFKNICGALRLQLKGTAKVKKIELKGNNGELLSGDATVTLYADGTAPTITMADDASTTVALDCGDGVQLKEDTPTDFLLTIPPSSFTNGFTAVITDIHGGMTKLTTSVSNTVRRSYIHTMPELSVNTDDYFAVNAAAIHISFDDVVACIMNLSTNSYSSLFDEPFFGWLEEMHSEYGARFSLYIYDLTRLAAVPATYKQEFFDARDWLKFGMHAKSSGYNYAAGTYADAQADWNSLVENVVRITGSHQSLDRIPRLHNFAGNLESVTGMRDGNSGALGFLGADDSRLSYHLTEEQNNILIERSEFTDSDNRLIVFRTNYRGELLGAADGMYEKMEAFMNNPAYSNCFSPFVWFTHEPYVYKNSSLTEYARNVEDVCRFASDYNIPFVYPQERIDLDVTKEGYVYEVVSNGIMSPNDMYAKEPLYSLSGGQDGTIYKGYSFQGNGAGTITIRDVATGVSKGTMKWNKFDLLKPHDNSVTSNVESCQNAPMNIPWKLKSTYNSADGLLASGSRAVSPKLPLSDYSSFSLTVNSCTFIVSCYDADDRYIGQINKDLNGVYIGSGQWLPAGTTITKEVILSAAPEVDHISLIAYNNELPIYECTYSGDVLHLYSNVYNSYASETDKHIGECCVFNVHGAANIWDNSLVQILKVGFIDDIDYWPSASEARPYGNFVVDSENGCLYVFVMYSSRKLTYWYKFDLPKVTDGVWDETCGCYVKTLQIDDITDQWTTPLQNYVQGACAHDGLIWSTEGFTATSGTNLARMRVIDPSVKAQIAVFNFYADDDPIEPEFIDFYNGRCYYGSVKQMYMLKLI